MGERTHGGTKVPVHAHFHHPQKRGGLNYVFVTPVGSLVPVAAFVLGVEGCSEDEGRANAAFYVEAHNSAIRAHSETRGTGS